MDNHPAVQPTTAAQREQRAAANAGAPTLEFPERTPYDAYVHASTLHSLQQTLSKEPGEMSFLVISQVMELYFGLTCFELREACRQLRGDDVWAALAPLRRCALHLEALGASWRGLRWMTPTDFNRFRDMLGEGSGFQSAMYRMMEFLLGLRSASLVRPFRGQPEVYRELVDTLEKPSVWDETIGVLHRRGYNIPLEVVRRDFAVEHQPHRGVEAAWVEIYHDERPDNDLRALGEALTEIADNFGEWRYRHLGAVLRTMGNKVGSGGSAGVSWLQRSMSRVVFPELWSARTAM